jgi:hypothetical protein
MPGTERIRDRWGRLASHNGIRCDFRVDGPCKSLEESHPWASTSCCGVNLALSVVFGVGFGIGFGVGVGVGFEVSFGVGLGVGVRALLPAAVRRFVPFKRDNVAGVVTNHRGGSHAEANHRNEDFC